MTICILWERPMSNRGLLLADDDDSLIARQMIQTDFVLLFIFVYFVSTIYFYGTLLRQLIVDGA